MKKILSILIASLLVLGLMAGAAMAEAAAEQPALEIDLSDLTVTFGAKSYTFPMSVEACNEAGLSIAEHGALEEGKYYPNLEINNGRNVFNVRIELCGGEEWATGVSIRSDLNPGMTFGGMTIGETTRAQIVDTLGEPAYSSSNYVDYRTMGQHILWTIYFDGESDDAKVDKISVYSKMPSKFGVEYSEIPEVAEADMPDVTSMAFNEVIINGKLYGKQSTVQDLLDNGWVLPVDEGPDTAVEGSSGFLVYGYTGYMYNGKDLIYVGAYNYGSEASTIAECKLNTVEVYNSYKTDLVLADGIKLGDAISAAETTFGAPASTEEDENLGGSTKYQFKVLGGVNYTFYVKDGAIAFMGVDDLQH